MTNDAPTNGGRRQNTAATRRNRTDLSLDTALGLLANARRRHVIRRVDAVGETSISDLAHHIAAREHNCSRRDVDSAQRKTVYVCLYQTHLQQLDEAGVIDYDKRSGAVDATDATERLAHILRDAAARTVGESPLRADGGTATVSAGESLPSMPTVVIHVVCRECDHERLVEGHTRDAAIATAREAQLEHAIESGHTRTVPGVVADPSCDVCGRVPLHTVRTGPEPTDITHDCGHTPGVEQ